MYSTCGDVIQYKGGGGGDVGTCNWYNCNKWTHCTYVMCGEKYRDRYKILEDEFYIFKTFWR